MLRGKKAVSAAVLEARHDALCYEMWLQQSQTSSRHGWPRATASTRAPRKAVPHCAAHANDAVGRVGQARAHRARGVGGRRRGRGRRRRDEGGVRAAARTRLHERPPPGLGCASAPLGAGSAHPRDGAPPSGEALPTVPRRAHSCCSPVASVGSWRGGGRAVPVGGRGSCGSCRRCAVCYVARAGPGTRGMLLQHVS